MKFKNVEVYGLEASIYKSGYPHQVGEPEDISSIMIKSGWTTPNAIARSKKLAKTPVGSGHNNFLKGIIVQFDMQYPEYFSPQLQRYHWIDIVSSQSKMHKITSRELTKGDFTKETSETFIDVINDLIVEYKENPNEDLFREILSNLPSGYLKWMGVSTNYLQLKTIYYQRKNHKLIEWQEFCEWIKTLPMSELITGEYDT